MIRTKIVCTIGPASREPAMLEKLMRAGMDVARLNFSHADHEHHRRDIQNIRAIAEKAGKPIAILADLQGPKLRMGDMADGGVPIYEGETVVLTTRDIRGHRTEEPDCSAQLPVQYQALPQDVAVDDAILIDDGLIELNARAVRDTEIACEVITGGVVSDQKGLNLPHTGLSIPSITEKDWDDLAFAVEQGVDWLAMSFVRKPDDVNRLKERIAELCDEDSVILVIAKIEKPQALDCIEEIVEVADGIMVARGDLGIEIPAEKVPIVQKRLIRLANASGKPVITATQMLDSMIRNPRPTRAEASDVANAILDGTDAIMLSGETAVGKYPLEALKTMEHIAREVEQATITGAWQPPDHIPDGAHSVTDAVSHATCGTAYDLRAEAIIASTASGATARTIAKYRPHMKVIGVTPHRKTQRQLMLSWGVIPLLGQRMGTTDEIMHRAVQIARQAGYISAGQRVVLTAGVTPNMPGTTNLMTVELVQADETEAKDAS